MSVSATILGIDIGGTKIAVGLYQKETFAQLAYEQLPTDASRGFGAVLADACMHGEKMRRKDTVAIGVGVAGLVVQPEGRLLIAPNIPGSNDIALRQMVEKTFNLPAAVENDARCFTLAEATLGAGKGHSVVAGVTLGTGVGGGIVSHGNILGGAHGYAGEFGHMLLQPGEPPYPTEDMRGEVEQFLSGTAMGKRCEAAKHPGEYLEGQACEFLHPLLFRELSWLITNLTYVIDPSVIVLGGSAGLALKPHIKDIVKELKSWLLPGTPLPALAIATVQHAGAVGAALLAGKVKTDK